MSIAEIRDLPLHEKLQLMEALWADLCRREEDIPVPQWHKDLLDERARLIEQGKARFMDWETAKKRIAAATLPGFGATFRFGEYEPQPLE